MVCDTKSRHTLELTSVRWYVLIIVISFLCIRFHFTLFFHSVWTWVNTPSLRWHWSSDRGWLFTKAHLRRHGFSSCSWGSGVLRRGKPVQHLNIQQLLHRHASNLVVKWRRHLCYYRMGLLFLASCSALTTCPHSRCYNLCDHQTALELECSHTSAVNLVRTKWWETVRRDLR